ncbi:hypothetical protein [Chitinivorax sp. B]|uniref:hypothetical protein n=1 Tax=Chitinivorax sp. B TaxID=2502235 RepID=UPI0010F6EE42|nr:hypothetical protein [Chitinivorax sp. B]
MPTLYEQLFNQVRDWGHCDLLVDPLAGLPPLDALDQADATFTQTPLLDRQFRARPASAPRLIRLDNAYSPLLSECVELAQWEATTTSNQLRSI